MIVLILSKLSNEVEIVNSFFIPISFDRLITLVKSLKKVHDLNDSVNQSLFLSIFLKRISILFILLPFDKNSLFSIDVKLISFSLRLKILRAFTDD